MPHIISTDALKAFKDHLYIRYNNELAKLPRIDADKFDAAADKLYNTYMKRLYLANRFQELAESLGLLDKRL